MPKWLKIRSIPLLIISCLASVVIWLVVMGTINPEMTIRYQDLGVRIQGATELYERYGYSILSETDFSFDVEFTGKRNSILRLKREDIDIICDVSKISGNGENRIQCSITTPYDDIYVKDERDLVVTVEVDKVTEKEITLRYELVGELDESYTMGEPTLAVDTVLVSGPTTELSNIAYGLVTADLTDMIDSTTLNLPVTLIGNSGEPIELAYTQQITKTAELSIPVYLIKEVPLLIRINSGGGLTDNEVDKKVTPDRVTLVGERNALSEIDYISLGSIDLDGIGDGITTEKQFVLPSGVKCRTDRSSATVEVTVRDIEIRSFKIKNIMPIGSVEGFNANIVTDYITVRLRGNKSVLDMVTEDDFVASVSLNSIPPTSGNHMVNASVDFSLTINAELLDADYNVTVQLRPSVTTEETVNTTSE